MVRKHRRGRCDRSITFDVDTSDNSETNVRLDDERKYCGFVRQAREMWPENAGDAVPSPINADLYYLMHQCLSGGPLRKTLEAFRQELNEYNMLPKRTDWTGAEHDSTIEDFQHQFAHIRPDYLVQLCCRANSQLNTTNQTLPDRVTSLFNLRKNINDVPYNFKQFGNYVRRHHWIPHCKATSGNNIVNILRGLEVSGPLSRRWIVSPKIYTPLQFQRRTLGHLSAVYCLLFDHSGNYIVTGADDLLIKLWSSRTGRLITTFRGASSEITDIAINLENTLLASGSIDRILRVWDLQTGSPVAVLSGHTGMITSVNFCPSPSWGVHYVITTSTDGSVAFWAYTFDGRNRALFRPKPTVYQEKMRPGQAQMICSSFSPGGTFLSTGSADHHVRVYYMKGDEGPHRILEIEAHTDRVDSIQWAHSGLRFLSGSKDGTAIIWSFECQQWKSIYLLMSDTTQSDKKTQEDAKLKLKVTMVAWDHSDSWAVTAVSDYTLKIWNARTGQFCKVLSGHNDEIYVLESHPHDDHVILSAGHDGQLYIWDINKGEIVAKYLNTIEYQGYGAIFDAKWSPDGSMIAASDSHGHLLIFGFGKGNKLYEQLPKELFFHTDYRPLVKDANNHVLDEQTQIQPHLMPPPFLVDIDGNPYPPMLQRLVPGREQCKTEQLIPSIVIGNEGTQEVIQVVAEELPSRYELGGEHSRRAQNRRSTRDEGIRQSTGDWQMDPSIKWKRSVLIPALKYAQIQAINDHIEVKERLEMDEYQRQLCQRPHMISTSAAPSTSGLSNSGKQQTTNEKRRKTRRSNATAALNHQRASTRVYVTLSEDDSCLDTDNFSVSSGHSDWVAEEPPKRTRRRPQITYHSDETDDNEEPEVNDSSDEEEEDKDEEDEDDDERERKKKKEKSPPKLEKRPQRAVRAPPKVTTTMADDDEPPVEHYRTSEWLTETRPRKSPYFPQIGDPLVYFPQGYQLYLDAVQSKNIYKVDAKMLAATKQPLRSHEFVKVLNVEYGMRQHETPPTLCSLKLAILDEEGRLTGRNVTVKYHDMPAVVDFLVLKQNFDMALSRIWQVGDRFRCIIDDCWWNGTVVGKSDANQEFAQSHFLCYEIQWDNDEPDRMSPWDMEPIDESRPQEDSLGALPVLQEELQNILYQPMEDDWPNNDRDGVTANIVTGLTGVMELSMAEPFLAPVDFHSYPKYASIVEYPVDLSTIKARFENKFYRRVTAAQYDVRHLAINAAKFNVRHTAIVRNARIITELCLRIIKQCTATVQDVAGMYRQVVENYESSDAEIDVEITAAPSGNSRNLRSLPNNSLKRASDWLKEAQNLINEVFGLKDSEEFRRPVNTRRYPDYLQVIENNPMDFGTVRERLNNKYYATPNDFKQDVALIFSNSRKYNTKPKSGIYVMTVRLAAFVEEHLTKLIDEWNQARRREETKSASGSAGSSKNSSDSDVDVVDDSSHAKAESSDEDNLPLNCLQTAENPSQKQENASDASDSSSESSASVDEDEEETNSDESEASVVRKHTRPVRKTTSSNRKRKISSSFDEDEEASSSSDSDDAAPPRSVHRNQRRTRSAKVQRPKRLRRYAGPKKREQSSEEDSGGGGTEDSDEEEDSNFLTSVSSRGRVRRLNPRVTALMKK